MAPKAAAAQSAITDPSKLVSAAMDGYNVPDDEVQDEKGANEELVLIGDDALLSANQKRVVAQLKESGMYSKIKIKRIALSFSGASVYFFSPMRKDGTPMPSSVLKLDTAECVRDEVGLTAKYGALFGLTTPKVKDVQFLEARSRVTRAQSCRSTSAVELLGFHSSPLRHQFSPLRKCLRRNLRTRVVRSIWSPS